MLQEGHPNCVAPGKRPFHTIIPGMATRGDDLFLNFGCMGAFAQPQGQVQILLNILRGMTVQAALDAPRLCVGVDTDNGPESPQVLTYLEEGITEDTAAELKKMGHNVQILTGWARAQFGRGQVIQRIQRGQGKHAWTAGSDPRADGQAVAQV